MEAARDAVKMNRWGAFIIPGIGTLQDIKLAARYGMDFIRIGTSVDDVPLSEDYIRCAKDLGMEVFANYMKTYVVSPATAAEKALVSVDYGADGVCVVDSAGGMLPEDVSRYVCEMKRRVSVPIGFHGHNNLGLAIANSLAAIEAGATVIDTSVRGMGRSSGNAVTEILIYALKRKSVELNIDTTGILDLAEKFIDPLLKNYQQVDSIGIVSGYAQFHSSFFGKIAEYASRYKVDPRELIIRVTRENQQDAPDELVDRVARELKSECNAEPRQMILPNYVTAMNRSDMGDTIASRAKRAAGAASSLALKWGKRSVFNLSQTVSDGCEPNISQATHEGKSFILSSGQCDRPTDALDIARAVDGVVDYILIDIDRKRPESGRWIDDVLRSIKESEILCYSDADVWCRSVVGMVRELVGPADKKIAVYGNNTPLSGLVTGQLSLSYTNVKFSESIDHLHRDADVWILCSPLCNDQSGMCAPSQRVVIDAWIGALTAECVKSLNDKGDKIYRVDMLSTIFSEIENAIEVRKMVTDRMGCQMLDGIRVASGGMLVECGAVIVDDYRYPSKVFGVADGKGFLRAPAELTDEDIENIARIEREILVKAMNA